MSRQEIGWDNVSTESGSASFKNERVFAERSLPHDGMKVTTFAYIEVFYNRKRLHATLGYSVPAQFLKDWSPAQ